MPINAGSTGGRLQLSTGCLILFHSECHGMLGVHWSAYHLEVGRAT
jgi:hypothetical protein